MNIDTAQLLIIFFCVKKKIQPFIHNELCVFPKIVCVLSWSVMSELFVTPWIIARHAPLSMDSPGKNTGVGFGSFLQGIFPT